MILDICQVLNNSEKAAMLLLNGDLPRDTSFFKHYSFIACTDGAYDKLIPIDVQPNLICGDFDSIESLPSDIEVVHLPDQDYTDFEKALTLLINRGFKHIDVYGADGGDEDHFLGNLSIGFKFADKVSLHYYNDKYIYFTLIAGKFFKYKSGKLISLFPFGLVSNITTSGLMYSLYEEDLETGVRTGTRNVSIAEEIRIDFLSGKLAVFIEK